MSDRPSRTPRSAVWAGAAATLAAGITWLVLAFITPTNTYHFGPVIAAAAWPIVARNNLGRPTPSSAFRIVALSTGAVVVIGLILGAADRLRGPTLWSDDGAIVESLLFAVAGGLIGLVALLRPE